MSLNETEQKGRKFKQKSGVYQQKENIKIKHLH